MHVHVRLEGGDQNACYAWEGPEACNIDLIVCMHFYGLTRWKTCTALSFQARLLSSVVSQRIGCGGICSFLA